MKKQIFYVPIFLFTCFFSAGVSFYGLQVFAATATVEGTATIVGQQTFTATDGGEFLFESDGLTSTFTVPEDFYNENLQLQVISNPYTEFAELHPSPSGMNFVGRVYHIDLFTLSGNPISNLDKAATVVLPYSINQISGFVESTLEPWHWTGLAWSPVPNFILDTDTKTVTFSTAQSSTFALFAEEEPEPEPELSPASFSGSGGVSRIITTPSTNETFSDQEVYLNKPTDSTPPSMRASQEITAFSPPMNTDSDVEDMEPAKIIDFTEIPAVVYSGKSFLVRGKTLPNTTVWIWSEWNSKPENRFANIFSTFGTFMTGIKEGQLETQYYTATVYDDGSFILEHPPITKINSGTLTVWAEVFNKEDAVSVAISEAISIPIQRDSDPLFKNSVVGALFLFVIFVIWLGRKKISLFYK